MAVNVKMGVDLGGFKSGIQEGQNILKGLNAEMKATEAEFKATGNAEQQLAQKTKTLNSQFQVQKGIADQAKRALQAMEQAGVKPTDAAYQKMYVTMMNATAGMNEAQAALNGLDTAQQETAKSANELTTGLNNIGKKISLQQVISGINTITSGLEKAAQKAIQLGKEIVGAVSESALWADDTATAAMKYGLTIERYQQMQGLVAGGMDTSVEAMLNAQKRLRKGVGGGTVTDLLRELALSAYELQDTGGGILEPVQKDDVQLFWEAGQALLSMSDAYDKEAAAQKLFGRSWEELIPLFDKYHNVEEYEAALATVNTVSEEGVNNLANLNDRLGELEYNFSVLKEEMLSALAPALETAAEALSGLLTEILEYLKTPEGQQALKDMETAVSGLFEDLGKIDPAEVVSGFKSVFDTVVGSLQWLVEHKDAVADALVAIVGVWGGLKITGGLLTIVNLINGLQGLGIIGGGAGAAGAGTATAAGSGLTTALTTGIGGLLPNILSWVSTNGGPVMDWLTHESPFASVLNGQESLGDWWNRLNGSVSKNAETFVSDWANNELIKFWTRRDANQDAADRTIFGDNWLPSYMQGIQPQVEVEPVAPEGASESISEEIGTVKVPVQLEVLDWRPSYMRGQGHANGLPFVPYDGYLAMLHRGERVLTASANRSYTYNSNNYFGNVNLNDGQDIDALCTSIDRHNRQMQSGFGA